MPSLSRWFIVVVLLFSLTWGFSFRTAYGANASGYCYLEGETNHAGTKVDFIPYPLGEVFCYTTYTNSSGYYYKSGMALGHYDVIFSHPGFVPDGLSYVEIVGSTTIPTRTLHPVSCTDLNWQQYPYLPSGTSIWFPEDEGKHNPFSTYPIEWWYVNFHLIGRTTGREYGSMIAIFKDGPMRLFSISDIYQQQNYTHADLPGILDASTSELDLDYTDQIGSHDIWRNMNYVAADLNCDGNLIPFTYRLDVDATAREDGDPMKLDIIMASTKSPLLVGGDGFVVIGSGWSYYYSHTKVKVFDESEITVHGLTEKISGYAWIDHQWGDFIGGNNLTWEWFSIKLDDLREIMVADAWEHGQPRGSYSGGFNLFNADCSLELLDDYTITPLEDWTDPVSGLPFITKWRIEEHSKKIDLIVTAYYDNQIMQVAAFDIFPLGCFWEGACRVSGKIDGQPVSGKAYAEMTHSRVAIPCTTWVVKPDGTGDFSTIQEAINAARDCDTIVLAKGTYWGDGNRDIDFQGKSIILSCENEAVACTVDCSRSATGKDEIIPHRGFYFHSEEDSTSKIMGVTVIHGDAEPNGQGGGILCANSSPTIEYSNICGNKATDGGGIACIDSASPTINYCAITGNKAFVDGGGVYCNNLSAPRINSCTISGNKANRGGGVSQVNTAYIKPPKMWYSIVWGNCAQSGIGNDWYWEHAIYYCCSDVDTNEVDAGGPGWVGACLTQYPNKLTDPMFCHPLSCDSAPTINGYYCLHSNSPCAEENSPECGLIGALGIGSNTGDCNNSGVVEVGDVVYLITYLYKGGSSPNPLWVGDVNCDGVVDVGDIVYLIMYLYRNGPPPCCHCPG